jgi:colicin import membrane protein
MQANTSDVQVNATSPAHEQATQQPAPEQNAAPPAERPAPEQAVPQQADAAAEQAAQREAELREQAEAVRQAAVKAYRKGEAAYRAGLLESGRLCGEYVCKRLALGDKREAAVVALGNALAPYSSSVVDQHHVNRLVRAYHAYRLLAEEQGLTGEGRKQGPADAVPYGTYRDAWSRLVERAAGGADGAPGERYVLLPGLEQECRALFAKTVADGLSAKAVGEQVAELVRRAAAATAEADKQRAAEAEAKARAEQEAAQKAAAELAAAEQAKRELEAKAKQVGDEATAAAVFQAQQELEAKQRAMVEQQAKAEQAERERQRAEKLAREQAAREAKAAERARKKATKPSTPATVAPSTPPAPQQGEQAKQGTVHGNLLTLAKAGTAKDVAGMVLELVQGCDTPDDVLELVLKGLKAGKALSAKGKRACDAALLVLTRQDKPAPATPAAPSPVDAAAALANANGHVAAVA